MHKFSPRTMLIFVIGLLLAVIVLGLGTAYMSKLKQQRRQLSDDGLFNRGALAAPRAESPAVRIASYAAAPTVATPTLSAVDSMPNGWMPESRA